METTFRLQPSAAAPLTQDKPALLGIPLFLYVTVFASLCVIVGGMWDISWHISIGRDGLFSPPHLAIYLGAVLSGVFSGYQVLKTTLVGTPAEKAETVRFWGVFYGPLGALFCIWGALAMLTSAPFDDWWHNAYGLDVKILSPPHTILGIGTGMVQFGAMVSVLGLRNRRVQLEGVSETMRQKRDKVLKGMFLLSAGLLLIMLAGIVSEHLSRHAMHHSRYYQVTAGAFTFFLVAVARASRLKWAATTVAGVYMTVVLLVNWILPLFPAEPKLGPILYHVTHFQPYRFPSLMIIPAMAIDWLMGRFSGKINDWLLSLLLGVAFVGLMLAVQWPMGDFLMSPAARNWFFGQETWYFGLDPNWKYRYAFSPDRLQTTAAFLKGIGLAFLIGAVSARIGLHWGKWMQQVQR